MADEKSTIALTCTKCQGGVDVHTAHQPGPEFTVSYFCPHCRTKNSFQTPHKILGVQPRLDPGQPT
jgi:hypothetical protein